MKDPERKVTTGYNCSEIGKIILGSYKVTGFVFGILSLRVLLLEVQTVNKAFQIRGGIDFFDTTLCSMRVSKTKKCKSVPKIVPCVYKAKLFKKIISRFKVDTQKCY